MVCRIIEVRSLRATDGNIQTRKRICESCGSITGGIIPVALEEELT
jgi:hypothetical protein